MFSLRTLRMMFWRRIDIGQNIKANLGWLIVLSSVIVVYVLLNLVLPRLLSGFIIAYIARPLLWSLLIALTLLVSKYSVAGKLHFTRSLITLSLLVGVLHLVFFIIAGIFFGFGRNPHLFTPKAVVTNSALVVSVLVGMEFSRAYLMNLFAKRYFTLALAVIALLYAVVDIPLASFTISGNPGQTISFLGSTCLPSVAQSLLASFLALVGGPLASIAYCGILEAFEWFSPILPNLPWAVTAFLGTIAPIIGLIVVESLTKAELAEAKSQAKGGSSLVAWVMVAVVCVAMLWFSLGLFGFHPTLVAGRSMSPAMKLGDIAVVTKVPVESIKVRDVIHYRREYGSVIHRVTEIWQKGNDRLFVTKGDANDSPDTDPVHPDQIMGKVTFVVPKLGWVSIGVRNFIGTVVRVFPWMKDDNQRKRNQNIDDVANSIDVMKMTVQKRATGKITQAVKAVTQMTEKMTETKIIKGTSITPTKAFWETKIAKTSTGGESNKIQDRSEPKMITRIITPTEGTEEPHLMPPAIQVEPEQNQTTIDASATDLNPPKVAFISPSEQEEVEGIVDVKIAPIDDVGIQQVKLYIDGEEVGSLSKDEKEGTYIYNWDTTAFVDGEHKLTAKAYDQAGNEGSSELMVVVNNPPAAPKDVSVTPKEDRIEITWAANTEPDLAGYNVYRAISPDAIHGKINKELITETTFSDTEIIPDIEYHYMVTAVDRSGKESDTPPAPPLDLTATVKKDGINLSWAASFEPDVIGYNVYRATSPGGDYEKINEELVTVTTFTDVKATQRVTYYYVVKAVDRVGKESEASNEAYTSINY
ncbi:MAG: signal peptidase I [Actinomycetota bacterium]